MYFGFVDETVYLDIRIALFRWEKIAYTFHFSPRGRLLSFIDKSFGYSISKLCAVVNNLCFKKIKKHLFPYEGGKRPFTCHSVNVIT